VQRPYNKSPSNFEGVILRSKIGVVYILHEKEEGLLATRAKLRTYGALSWYGGSFAPNCAIALILDF